MKKLGIIKITLAVLLCLTLFLALFSCKKGDDAIKIEKLPLRTVYYVGEAPTLDGMILSVKTENGRESIEATDDMLSESSKLIFTKKGDATVTVEYNGLSLSFVVFVDDDITAHKTFALSYLSVWAEDEAVLDEVTLSCIERAKQLISESDSHEKIAEHLENAKDYAYTYSEGIRYKEKLDTAKNEAKSTLLSFDFSAYTLDYAKKIADLINDALSDVETSGTLDEVETTLNSLRKEADEMKSDERNKRVFAFEAEFKTVYENKAALFPESEYEDLLLKLIDAEEKIREAATDEAAEMLSKDFFEKAESTFLTYPKLIYKKISALKRDELIFGEDKKSLDELACDIFTFAKNLDGESFGGSEYNKIEDLLALNKDESFKSLSSYAALSKYETKTKTLNLIEEALSLYDDYKLLIQASNESDAVISAIDAIGKVTLESTEKIEAARLAYKTWSEKFSIGENSANAF
ncbi:MAG: bacterial Ig-like domain-containing protein, partial [Clostridia bacterium]|nr:bacterial Ig-like domain-containing protein [Clostridia bacterium]